jgi:hypothetical protein
MYFLHFVLIASYGRAAFGIAADVDIFIYRKSGILVGRHKTVRG